MLISQARTVWTGDLRSGTGTTSGISSQAFTDLPLSWSSRTTAPAGRTSPEELLAAAHASCFAMALSLGLSQQHTPPSRLDVEARVAFDQVAGDWRVVSSDLTVRGQVSGIDQVAFQAAAEAAKDGCPVSQALKGNVALSVTAILSGPTGLAA